MKIKPNEGKLLYSIYLSNQMELPSMFNNIISLGEEYKRKNMLTS